MGFENNRLHEVERFLQVDFDKYREFKEITDLASELCDKPVSLITLLDKDVNWVKVATGVDMISSPRELSFCQYAITQDDMLLVPDTTKDPRFSANPLVREAPKVRFYAGAPLILSNGYRLGTLCLFDFKPGNLTALQQKALTAMSRQVTFIMELELTQRQLLSHITEIEAKNESLRAIAQLQSHDIRQPLTGILGLVNLVKEGHQAPDDNWLKMMSDAARLLDSKIHAIVNESIGNKDLKLLRFNRMVEEIEDYAILLLDEHGNIENWNKGAQKIKGYNTAEIIGKNFSVFYTDKDNKEKRPQHLLEEAAENGVARDEGWRVKKDGTRFWARVVITAIHSEDGDIIGFTKVTRDLTDRLSQQANRA